MEFTPTVGHMTLERALRHHAFTEGLTQAQLATLERLVTEVEFSENEIILEDGQRSSYFYLLVEGSAAVELRTPRYAVCVQALEPGHVFGWSALLAHQDTLFQVRSRERTRALRIEGALLAAACHADPEFGTEILLRMLRVVAGRVKATETRFAEMCGVRV